MAKRIIYITNGDRAGRCVEKKQDFSKQLVISNASIFAMKQLKDKWFALCSPKLCVFLKFSIKMSKIFLDNP